MGQCKFQLYTSHHQLQYLLPRLTDYGHMGLCKFKLGPNQSEETASTAADNWIRFETYTDPCGHNRSEEASSTAADDDLIRVETCTGPRGPNRSEEASSTAADDDLNNHKFLILSTLLKIVLDRGVNNYLFTVNNIPFYGCKF